MIIPAVALGAGRLCGLPQTHMRIPALSSSHAALLTPSDAQTMPFRSTKRAARPLGRWVSTAIAQADSSAAPTAPSTRLDSLELNSVVSVQGYINPDVPADAQATVFAIYDQAKMLQYIGFSKNLRSSLLTVFARRPDKTHFYRAAYLNTLDQQAMLDLRAAWFDQSSGPPPGNKLPAERAAWQEAATPFVISDRGKVAAAEELAKTAIVKIKARGCKEEFVLNRDGILEGRVEFLAVADLSPVELERQRREAEAAAAATRRCMAIVDDEPFPFEIFIKQKLKTNGGFMFDLRVTANERETTHRVIVSSDYYDVEEGLDAEGVLERVFAFLLAKGVPRHTEGIMLSSEFPINYFAVSEVTQHFDDFADAWGGALKKDFWRFNRTQDYGMWKGEDVAALSEQFRPDLMSRGREVWAEGNGDGDGAE
jgi:hypothetical protein